MFEYDIVENEYGPQLAVSFQYDERTIEQIKSLSWETTHRAWSEDHDAWLIDYTEQSLEEFQDQMNVVIPPRYTPSEDHSGVVHAVVPDEYAWFFLQDPSSEIDDLLWQELAYWNDAYKEHQQQWIRLYDTDTHGAPIGLLDKTRKLVEASGYEFTVTWNGDRKGGAVQLDWEFPSELRGYQRDAINAVKANDGGIIALPTGTGKTVTAMKLLEEVSLEMGRGIVLVHTQELLYQWESEIRDALRVEPGVIGDGNWSEGPVTIAVMQTLMSRGVDELDESYGVAVFDECHRTSAADTMHDIGMDLNVAMRVGLSATPWRRIEGEELMIEGAVGGEAHTVTAEEMIDAGYLSEPRFDVIDPRDYGRVDTANTGEAYHDAYRRCISLTATRNRAIAAKTAELANLGYQVLVNVDRIKHGRLLEYALNRDVDHDDVIDAVDFDDAQSRREFISALQATSRVADTNAEFMHGADTTKIRQDTLDEFQNGDLDILVSTLLREGVDIPNISAIVLAQAGKSDVKQIQVIGRALRPKNGDHARIVDVNDTGRYFRSQFEKRITAMREYYGEYGPSLSDFDVEPTSDDGPPESRSLTDEPPESFEDLYDN